MDPLLRYYDQRVEAAFWASAKKSLLAVDTFATFLVIGTLMVCL